MKVILFLMLFLAAANVAACESLWVKNPPGNLCRDTKAREVGDLLTIVIDEQAEVSKESSRSTSKKSATELGVDLFRLFGWEGDAAELPGLKWDSSREFDGEAEYSSTDSFTKRLSVIVKEVLPNGNLLIEGRRQMSTEGDKTTITITGVVRPIDVREDNSVPSELVADAQITYDTKGPAGKNTRQGWFLKLLDVIWPF